MSADTAVAEKTTFWTADRVADALAPLSPVNLPRPTRIFGRVWTDTRTIEQGDLFVALIGGRFDAHDFLADAVAKGATGLVVSRADRARNLGVPVFEVADTLVALGALATFYRRASNRPVVGVVGTNGKTSTKELIKAALGSRLEVHATRGNLNNLIGVPLTLLSMPAAVEATPARALDERLPGGKVTRLALITGAAAHDVYHAGQIQLLKKLYQRRGIGR